MQHQTPNALANCIKRRRCSRIAASNAEGVRELQPRVVTTLGQKGRETSTLKALAKCSIKRRRCSRIAASNAEGVRELQHQTPKVFANCSIKRRRRSLISAQGCHNPGSKGKRDINAEGVGEMQLQTPKVFANCIKRRRCSRIASNAEGVH